MDVHPETSVVLPYGDPTQIEDGNLVLTTSLEPVDGSRSLAERIGNTKVYLLSEASKSRVGKVRGQHIYATLGFWPDMRAMFTIVIPLLLWFWLGWVCYLRFRATNVLA